VPSAKTSPRLDPQGGLILGDGYAENVVADAESFELKPSVGEALLFDPRNFYAVRPSRDSRRIALGFSVGLADTGDLLTWG
jgi:hypothetical protein